MKGNEELRQIQLKSLEILKVFKKFCDDNDLLFYFCGGCCIGTIRHKGFIPWDDDIDVFMPRRDYQKLQILWNDKMRDTHYKLCQSNKNEFVRSLITYICDENTTFIKQRQKDLDICHGIRLEIIPLDGCPSSKVQRKIQMIWALIRQLFLNQEPFLSKGKGLQILSQIALWFFPTWKLRYKIAKFAENQMSKYKIEDCDKITELCTRYEYMINEYPKEAFESATYKEFEGEEMPIPIGYDTYLKMAFGNYMELPPEEKQIPKHDAVRIDVNQSYKVYRGRRYLEREFGGEK